MSLVSRIPCIDGFISTSNRLEEFREELEKRKNIEISNMSKKGLQWKDVENEDTV